MVFRRLVLVLVMVMIGAIMVASVGLELARRRSPAVHPTPAAASRINPTTETTTPRPEPSTTATSGSLPRSSTTRFTTTTTTTTIQVTSPSRLVGSLAGKIIAIDPGHDGANGTHPAEINRLVPAGGFLKACDTTGTQTNSSYAESAYTLDVSLRLAAVLRQAGATVVLTRTTNDGVGPCVNQRAAIGNQAHADAAISIHADGGPAGGRGFHVIQPALVPGYTEGIVAPSQRLALAVRGNYLAGTGIPFANYIGHEGLDTRGDLGGLNLSTVPKVFIECGNMRNATDAALLSDAQFRQTAAQAIGAGIRAFLGA